MQLRRRTISVSAAFYERVVAYCDARDLSISGLVEHVLRQDVSPEAVERATLHAPIAPGEGPIPDRARYEVRS